MLKNLTEPKTPENSVPFHLLDPRDFMETVDQALDLARRRVKNIESQTHPDFKNTMEALEVSSRELNQVTSVFFNLHYACTNETIDSQAAEISQKLANYSNDIYLSEKLFKQIQSIYESHKKETLSKEQKKLMEETHLEFVRNGALLSPKDKEKLRDMDQQLAALGPLYSQNLLKATHAFHLNIEDPSKVNCLPESVREAAREEAKKRKEKGWTFHLQAPSYIPFMKYMEDSKLRQKMWTAFNSRSLQGEFSNRPICQKIARLRQKRARLLGYPTHAHYVLEKRMAGTPKKVLSFLEKLKSPFLKAAKKELKRLKEFVSKDLAKESEIQAWDFGFYSQKLKTNLYDFNDEDLRPYFPLQAVVEGLFIHANKLYGLEFSKEREIPVYHPEVEVYRSKKQGRFTGLLYLDLFTRKNKQGGAWMTHYKEQGFDGQRMNRPHISIVCNFSRPTGDKPSLLTFQEVQTLFHEFGHSLHALLSDCYYPSLSGTHVFWDFVELPSQIMENWTYEKESLDLFARHYRSGEKIPGELVKKIRDSMNFQIGIQSLRQIGLSMLDMNWHTDLSTRNPDPMALEREVLREFQLLPEVPETNLSVSFSHIFDGGYSAGYYSYKWAEVLDADAFEVFKKEGLFHQQTAHRFEREILSRGGVEDPVVLYRNFRGRDPDIDALLRRSGLL